jgi:hypothetical protein
MMNTQHAECIEREQRENETQLTIILQSRLSRSYSP